MFKKYIKYTKNELNTRKGPGWGLGTPFISYVNFHHHLFKCPYVPTLCCVCLLFVPLPIVNKEISGNSHSTGLFIAKMY